LRPCALSRRTVEGLPICWWLPPPKGCSTGFIHTPRTTGHSFLLACTAQHTHVQSCSQHQNKLAPLNRPRATREKHACSRAKRPAQHPLTVATHLVLVEGVTGLEQWLVDTAAARDNADHGAASVADGLTGARGELDADHAGIGVLGHDGAVVTGGARDGAAVARHVLEVAHNGTLGHLPDGHHVAHSELGLLAAVDKLASVHALGRREQLLLDLEAVRGAELHDGERSATSRIVDDFLHDTLDVAGPLGIVEVAEAHGTLAVLRVRLEDGPGAFTLRANAHTHGRSGLHELETPISTEKKAGRHGGCQPRNNKRPF